MRQPPSPQKASDEIVRRRYAKRSIETYRHWIEMAPLAAGTQAIVLNMLCIPYQDVVGRPFSLLFELCKESAPS
jgi:hypothetical protein